VSKANGTRDLKAVSSVEIHEPNGDDVLDFIGILAGGGLAGQAASVLQQVERHGMSAAIGAFSALIMGALANHGMRDELRAFLFTLWASPEDRKAAEEDLDDAGKLKPRINDAGEPEPGTLYREKRRRWAREVKGRQIGQIVVALYRSEAFLDFLDWLREDIGTSSIEQLTSSKESTASAQKR
jgi:hypothetical protein